MYLQEIAENLKQSRQTLNPIPMKTLYFTPFLLLLFSANPIQAQSWACKQCISRGGTCSALPKAVTIECICKKESSDLNGNGSVNWLERFQVAAGISTSLVIYETRTAIGTECFYTNDVNTCCVYAIPRCPCDSGSSLAGPGDMGNSIPRYGNSMNPGMRPN